MQVSGLFKRPATVIAALVVAVAIIAIAVAFEPVTRSVVASQFVCFGCHFDSEYDHLVAGSPSKRHPATPEGGDARCVDCHVPEGWADSAFVYTHYIDGTDLFGHSRDQKFLEIFDPNWRARTPNPERFPAAVTPIAKKAYRVRDRLLEYDSITCRSCHIEAEIKVKRKRGRRAHANALKNKETCILCHYNLVHREVDVRPDFGE
jgi:nitrate/TMAO reductase-like tetraheme cytochrome c subunit